VTNQLLGGLDVALYAKGTERLCTRPLPIIIGRVVLGVPEVVHATCVD